MRRVFGLLSAIAVVVFVAAAGFAAEPQQEAATPDSGVMKDRWPPGTQFRGLLTAKSRYKAGQNWKFEKCGSAVFKMADLKFTMNVYGVVTGCSLVYNFPRPERCRGKCASKCVFEGTNIHCRYFTHPPGKLPEVHVEFKGMLLRK